MILGNSQNANTIREHKMNKTTLKLIHFNNKQTEKQSEEGHNKWLEKKS